jgi:hypothetical protein
LLQGSVWEDVHRQLEWEEGNHQVKVDSPRLRAAFMQETEQEGGESSEQTKRPAAVRCTLLQKPLSAEILHANLVRQGFSTTKKLVWAIGHKAKEEASQKADDLRADDQPTEEDVRSSEDSEDSDIEDVYETVAVELHQNALDTLSNLYILCDEGCERQLLSNDSGSGSSKVVLAPVEELLRDMILQGGSLEILQSRAEALLYMSGFPAEAHDLEAEFRVGIAAAEAVVKSTTMPKFLGCVLLIGNYVNSNSNALGGALGVTLDSLAKLANTRCLQPGIQRQSSNGFGPGRAETALSQVIRKLDEAQGPFFLPTLVSELQSCRGSKAVDVVAMQASVVKLTSHIATLEKLVATTGSHEPPHLQPRRLANFLSKAKPQMETLQRLANDLEFAIDRLRAYFAEPPTQSFKNMMDNLNMFIDKLPANIDKPSEERPASPLKRSPLQRHTCPNIGATTSKPSVPKRRLKTMKTVSGFPLAAKKEEDSVKSACSETMSVATVDEPMPEVEPQTDANAPWAAQKFSDAEKPWSPQIEQRCIPPQTVASAPWAAQKFNVSDIEQRCQALFAKTTPRDADCNSTCYDDARSVADDAVSVACSEELQTASEASTPIASTPIASTPRATSRLNQLKDSPGSIFSADSIEGSPCGMLPAIDSIEECKTFLEEGKSFVEQQPESKSFVEMQSECKSFVDECKSFVDQPSGSYIDYTTVD